MIGTKKTNYLFVVFLIFLAGTICFAQEGAIVKVGDEVITHEDIDRATANIPAPFKKAFEKKNRRQPDRFHGVFHNCKGRGFG